MALDPVALRQAILDEASTAIQQDQTIALDRNTRTAARLLQQSPTNATLQANFDSLFNQLVASQNALTLMQTHLTSTLQALLPAPTPVVAPIK